MLTVFIDQVALHALLDHFKKPSDSIAAPSRRYCFAVK